MTKLFGFLLGGMLISGTAMACDMNPAKNIGRMSQMECFDVNAKAMRERQPTHYNYQPTPLKHRRDWDDRR